MAQANAVFTKEELVDALKSSGADVFDKWIDAQAIIDTIDSFPIHFHLEDPAVVFTAGIVATILIQEKRANAGSDSEQEAQG